MHGEITSGGFEQATRKIEIFVPHRADRVGPVASRDDAERATDPIGAGDRNADGQVVAHIAVQPLPAVFVPGKI